MYGDGDGGSERDQVWIRLSVTGHHLVSNIIHGAGGNCREIKRNITDLLSTFSLLPKNIKTKILQQREKLWYLAGMIGRYSFIFIQLILNLNL